MRIYAIVLLTVITAVVPAWSGGVDNPDADADSTVIESGTADEVTGSGPEKNPGEKKVESEYDIDSLKNYADCIKAGNMLSEKGFYFHARKVFHKALGFKPDNHEVYNLLGRAYYNTSENEKAKMFLKTAIAIKPDYADAHYNLGDVYFREGKLNDAMNSFKTAIGYNDAYRKRTRKFFGEMFAPLE
ncbi:tetratricopeptide repeat protein [Candidatus Latescibacterota bacterium]